jgi:indole-3-glycerol phosphate synthase
VLTEPDHFGGSMTDLESVAAAVAVPVLRKDFIVSSVQLFEARARGAAAALLIVRALPHSALIELHDIGVSIGLDLLVEVRDESELAIAIDMGATIIGVNNRNLESLVIDPTTVGRIVPLIPRDIVAVAESGMASPADVERAARAGADAVLVGSYVSAASDPLAAVRSLTGIAVERNARPD